MFSIEFDNAQPIVELKLKSLVKSLESIVLRFVIYHTVEEMQTSIFQVCWIRSLIKEDKQSILMDTLNIDQISDRFLQIIH